MTSPNFVYLEGYIQRAEIREVGRNGNQVLSFTLAVRGRGEDAEYSYFDVDHWNTPEKIASAIVEAGEQDEGPSRKFGIRGSLHQERWESEDGDKRSRVKIRATTIFLPQYSQDNDEEEESSSSSQKKNKRSNKKSGKKSGKKKGSKKGSSRSNSRGGKKRRREEPEDEDYEDPDSDDDGDGDDEVPF